jgi:hypothetical protein
MSLLELMERIQKKLDGDLDLVLKLQGTVAEALGMVAPTALAMRFDDRLAKTSMHLYDIASIPAIRGEMPIDVTQVRFRSDLSRINPLDRASLAESVGPLRALLPQTP